MLKTFLNRCSRFSRMASGALVLAALASCGGGDPMATTSATASVAAPHLRDKAQAAASNFTGNGWYWDAAAGGTGIMFEAQGDAGFLGLFMYEADGRPVWYAAGGTFVTEGAGYRFTGDLRQYANGQALNGTYRTPSSVSLGTLSIAFTGTGTATKASTVLPGGRTWNMERFNFGALGWGPAPTQPETGWFWNKAEGGRGYAIEVQGTQVFMAMFHYTAAGAPTWQIINGDISSGVMASTPFNAYAGGQSLAGAPKTPTATQEGNAAVSFSRACDGNLLLPGAELWLGIERFTFGVSQPCRTAEAGNPFGGNLVTSVAEASYPFLSDERKAWNVLNAERSRCGFGLVSQNALLDLAARNHRDYIIANPESRLTPHTETPGRTGFTGIDPQNRTDAVGYRGISTEGVRGSIGNRDLQGSTSIRVFLSGPYHELDILRGNREVGFAQGNGLFQVTSATAEGVATQTAPGVRTWPCQGTVDAPFAGNNEDPSPFPSEQSPIWGTPILVKGDGAIRIATATITGPDGAPVPLKVIYGDGQTTDPHARCIGDTSCIIPVQLAQKTIFQVRLTGTNGGQPLHPSGVLSFSFISSGMMN